MTYWIDILDQALIFAIFALSLNLLLGYAGQVSIAQAAFGAIGGYTAGYLGQKYGWAFVPGVALGTVLAAALGFIVSLPALWLSNEFLILLTLAVQTIVIIVLTSIAALGGLQGLAELPLASLFGSELLRPEDFLRLLVPAALLVFLLMRRIGGSPMGRVLRGIRDDQLATQSLGKNVFLHKSQVFVIAAGFAGFAGALLAYYNGVVAPGLYGFDQSMAIIVMVVIGGSGNFYGSLIGAAFVVGANPFFDKVVHLNPEKGSLARLVAYGVALVLVLRWRPQGILPEGATPRTLLRRLRRADRGQEPAPGVARPTPPTVEHADGEAPVALEAVALTKSFGGIHAVKDLSFALERGRITGLIGPNGAGKTTVFNLLTGAIKPDGGAVFLNGAEVTGQPVHRLARAGIVRSFQGVRVYPKLTALENVMMGVRGQRGERLTRVLAPAPLGPGERRTRDRAMEHLGFVGLDGQAGTPAGAMAFGEQKLIALARVLATEAEVLLLDEPASGIDKRWVDRMVELIAQLPGAGFTVCIVEHNLNFIDRLAQKICFMQDGAVRSEGTMAELREQEGLQEVYFGTAL